MPQITYPVSEYSKPWPRREAPARVRGYVVDELDRPPCPCWLLSQSGGEGVFAEVIGHPRGVREQLPRRGTWKGVENAPAVEELRRELVRQWLVECQVPLAGEPDGHGSGHALRYARRAKGIFCAEGAARAPRQAARRPGPNQTGVRPVDTRQRTGRARRDPGLDRSQQAR